MYGFEIWAAPGVMLDRVENPSLDALVPIARDLAENWRRNGFRHRHVTLAFFNEDFADGDSGLTPEDFEKLESAGLL